MANEVLNENGQNHYDPKKAAGENIKSVLSWMFRLRGVALSTVQRSFPVLWRLVQVRTSLH